MVYKAFEHEPRFKRKAPQASPQVYAGVRHMRVQHAAPVVNRDQPAEEEVVPVPASWNQAEMQQELVLVGVVSGEGRGTAKQIKPALEGVRQLLNGAAGEPDAGCSQNHSVARRKAMASSTTRGGFQPGVGPFAPERHRRERTFRESARSRRHDEAAGVASQQMTWTRCKVEYERASTWLRGG